jgi:hypothetical protein
MVRTYVHVYVLCSFVQHMHTKVSEAEHNIIDCFYVIDTMVLEYVRTRVPWYTSIVQTQTYSS